MPFQFERFTETDKSFAARVTVRQNGQLGFNEGARNAFDLHKFGFGVLFFDRGARVVGIVLTNSPSEDGAIPLRADPKNSYLPAKGFLEKYGIAFEKAQRFELKRDGEYLVFNLGEPLGGASEENEKTAS